MMYQIVVSVVSVEGTVVRGVDYPRFYRSFARAKLAADQSARVYHDDNLSVSVVDGRGKTVYVARSVEDAAKAPNRIV